MGRIKGAKNRDHDEARAGLIQAITGPVLGSGGLPLSLRQLAKAANVDAATLRHYFKDRLGVVSAVFESLLPIGEMRRQMALDLLSLPPLEAFSTLLKQVCEGWASILGGLHAIGFAEGMQNASLGQSYVSTILEPTLGAFEEMLAQYHARGALHVPDARVASLGLAAPAVLALFHQYQLSGSKCRPLDLPAFVDAHVAAFLRGYLP